MRARVWTMGAVLLALAGCEPYASTIPTSPQPQAVAPAAMPEACRRAASARFAQRLDILSAAPAVQQSNGTWLVTGSYPSQGVSRVYRCVFSAQGTLTGLDRP